MDQNPGFVPPSDTAPNTTRADPKQPPAAQGEASSNQDSSTQSNNQAGSAADVPADTSDAAPDAARKEATVTTACLACRSKHLKCDGSNPCSRCVLSGFECIYVASRRGYRGPRRTNAQNPNKRRASSPLGTSEYGLQGPGDSTTTPSVLDGSGVSPSLAPTGSPANQHFDYVQSPDAQHHVALARSGKDASAVYGKTNNMRPISLPEKCIDSFYHNFFASHPFVLPKRHLLALPMEPTIETLFAAIRWVGSLFLPEASSVRQTLYETAYQRIYAPETTSDGFIVQAMVLLIVALDGNCEQEKARHILADVETIAVQLGLPSKTFSIVNGRGMAVMEESWRRTWWDLFIVDGMVAGVHRVTNFLLYDIVSDVPLPCEEHQYLSGTIPQPLTLEDLETRDFSGDTRPFSSFAYRIQCGRNLGRYMRTPPFYGPDDENVARMETLLTNWRLHLPLNKRDALQHNGQLDEMMFQAHMMNHATSIMLHQQFSQLDSAPTQTITSCAPYQMVPAGGGDMFNSHTKHTIVAASEISKLITHRVPLLSHTHFFTCVVTLSSIVHLSRWAHFWMVADDQDLREQIRLNVGALQYLSSVWSAASRAGDQVRSVAQEIYRAKKQHQNNSQYWIGFTPDAMMSSIAVDDSIISDIERIGGSSANDGSSGSGGNNGKTGQ